MRKNILKLLSLIVVSLLIVSSFAACKSSKGSDGTGNQTTAKTSASAAKATGSAAKATGSAAKGTGSDAQETDAQGNPVDNSGDAENPDGGNAENPGGGEVVTPVVDDNGIQKVNVDLQGATLTFVVRLASVDSMPLSLIVENPSYTAEEFEYTKDQAIAAAAAAEAETGLPDTHIYNLAEGRYDTGYIGDKLWYDAMKKYNFNVATISESSHGAVVSAINSNYAAGTYYADVGLVNTKAAFPYAADTGSLVAWEDVGFNASIDPRLTCNDWIYTSGQWKGKHYGFVKPDTAEVAMYYNLDLFNQLGLPDVQQFVWNNTWTWNTFLDIAKAGTMDLNSDGVMDIYGAIGNSPGETGDAISVSNGIIPVAYDSNTQRVNFQLNTQAGVRALQFMSQLVNTDKVLYIPAKNGNTEFVAGRGTMLIGYPSSSVQNISDAMQYGWAPMPMGPDTDKYLAIRTNKDIFSAISGAPHSNVLPYIIADAVCSWDTTKDLSVTPDFLVSNLYKVGSKIQRQQDVDICKAFLGQPVMTFAQSFSSTNKLINDNIYTQITSMTTTPRAALDQWASAIQGDLDAVCGQ